VTRVKICGITNREDAAAAIEYGADALGFIFVPHTPRYVGARPDLIELLDSVPPFISRVGVCVCSSDIAREALSHLDVIQLYDHTPDIAASPHTVIPAFRLRNRSDVDSIGPALQAHNARAVHLDAYHETSLGGSGELFDWELAVLAKAQYGKPVILAGGLKPENVADAIRTVRPYAVDVSSGVESGTPGRKDHSRIKEFITAVRAAL
jgi:phosphoribosylanthranilate isomerase